MIDIAGVVVKKGDRLYHTGLQAWGFISDFDKGSVVYKVEGRNKDNFIEMRVTSGGYVNGRRVIFWHKPIALDLPTSDVSPYQSMVDYIVTNFKPKG